MNLDKMTNIRNAITTKYAEISQSALGKFKYQTGKAGAISLGYDPNLLQNIPEETLNSFCGVGNPFSLGTIYAGDAVLDIGSGAGVDLHVACSLVGEEGLVFGIDITPEMVSKANASLEKVELNSKVVLGSSEAIPFPDETFDVVFSNGVLNLSPVKEQSFKEIYRVLKPGGRLQFADIVLKDSLPTEITGNVEAWSN
ncbi:methyltransferase domain-containing protein [Anaerobacillus sp. CMMVII]|nr:methyltransferase domain-containing protein [Anaerobacillus sp. CMMVII]MCT8136988.1 methyltransferase domain-containing protein [Anaerobacillus sp. CMMVII]